ncbi:MAG: sulfatase [Planctomycetota bacterium]|jgi:arylsulfatase A-like enzyme|nr:sulfatase [Planctomycetota bacterium]
MKISEIDSHQSFLIPADPEMALQVMGAFDPASFNSVAVSLHAAKQLRFTVMARDQSGNSFTTPRVESTNTADEQVLVFDLEGFPVSGAPFNLLAVSVRGRVEPVAVNYIDLLYKPPGLSLPQPDSGPQLIRAADEMRTGVAVAPGRGVWARGAVPPNAELRFSYLQPKGFQRESGGELRLELSNPGGVQLSESYPLDEAVGHWREVRVPIDLFSGQDMHVSWSLPSGVDGACALAEVGIRTGAGRPQHVLLITSDTHRADHLGHAGRGIDILTPNLDQLASKGIAFENCFTSTNVTNPSHIALMTATHPRDTGVLSNHEPINSSAATLAEAFRAAGFATYASISSRHLSHHTSGLGQGFDRMVHPFGASVSDAAQAMMPVQLWLDESQDVSTFTWLHLFDAHTPYAPPQDLTEAYYGEVERAYDESLPKLKGDQRRALELYPGLRDLTMPPAMYRGEITYLDRELGKLLSRADMANAIVAFTSDHGESLGHHGIYYEHRGLYPDAIHVPLILSYPAAPAGRKSAVPIRQIDVGRTLLDLAGAFSAEFPGNNLLVQAEEGGDGRRFALAAHGAAASITDGPWHLIIDLPVNGGRRGEGHIVRLFNLADDPGAEHDLLERRHAKARELYLELVSWMRATEDRGWRGGLVTDAETLRQLETLGYTAATGAEVETIELLPENCKCTYCKRMRAVR